MPTIGLHVPTQGRVFGPRANPFQSPFYRSKAVDEKLLFLFGEFKVNEINHIIAGGVIFVRLAEKVENSYKLVSMCVVGEVDNDGVLFSLLIAAPK